MEGPPEPQGLVMVVTGGSGFLGSHLVQVLLEAEPELRELRILDVKPDPAAIPEQHRSRVRLFRGDVGDLGALGAVLAGAQVCFHSASLVDVWGRCSPEAIARVNVLGTKNVIRGCQAGGVQVLIYTSSMEVVGPNTRGDPFVRGDEETPYPTRHSEPYPLSKAQAERLVLDANGAKVAGGGRLVTLSLRPTGIFGERHPLLELFYRRGRGLGGLVPRTLPRNAEHGRVYAGNVAWMRVLDTSNPQNPQIPPKFHPESLNFIQIPPKFLPNFSQISPKFHPKSLN
ncbi:3 beta-hydroxysteroid dehydrogenase type 7-like, partial [Chamaea fasciata]|uniref:3 beta-hydroxysteroid dehydrogenase type 7-like n=1 Tax=Chamaea fasciata TaxID=190680 RepID=UPI003369DBE4